MTFPFSDRVLVTVERYFTLSPEMLALTLDVSDVTGADRPLSLHQARQVVLDSNAPPRDRDLIWSRLVELANKETEPWQVVAVWMMIPGLGRICRRCHRYLYSVAYNELESEALVGFLEALHAAHPGRAELGPWLFWTTYRHVQKFCQQSRKETPAADVELTAQLAGQRLDKTHNPGPSGNRVLGEPAEEERSKSASRTTVEGERLGSVAQRLGLADVVDINSDKPRRRAA